MRPAVRHTITFVKELLSTAASIKCTVRRRLSRLQREEFQVASRANCHEDLAEAQHYKKET